MSARPPDPPVTPPAPRTYPERPRELDPNHKPRNDFLSGLNTEQAAAAAFSGGPLLIIAGAGTGKTRTLVHRVAHLVSGGVRPERILLLTFTRRAAQEMLARAERLAGAACRGVQGGTFHASAHRLLRRFGKAAGLDPEFSIMDQGDAEDLMHLARAQLGYGTAKRRFPKKQTLLHVYSTHINTGRAVADVIEDSYAQFFEFADDFMRIFADYTRRKAERNLVDYDDLLLFWAMLLEAPEGNIGERVAALYDHVLVDEYQDTNLLQARILRGLCARHGNLTVVGDDAQSIYSFRGASIRNILEFPTHFPGTTIVALEQNYRSTQPILDSSNALISRATERYTKSLWTRRTGGEPPWLVTTRDESEQTRFVVDRLLELHEQGTPLAGMAVIFRAGYMSADLEIELTNRGIPFEKWGGLKFLEAAHVKDALAFLRILDNPRDEVSWYRVLMLLPGIGEMTARSAIESMAQMAWESSAFGRFKAPPRSRDAHRALVALLDTLRSGADTGSVSADIHRVRTLYDDILREKYDRVEPRLADLDQLETIAGGYPSRAAFLSALALEPPRNTQDLAGGSDDERDALVLTTAHSAKGKEWDAVFVIWAADGWFPMARALRDDEQLDEERRLMYVALTRARDHLAVVCPLNSYSSRMGADYSIDQLSRFLDRGVRATMQLVTPARDAPLAEAPPPPMDDNAPRLDLRSAMAQRFRIPER
jgi:DNA helicase-2/ATP-dependent DNA helicase PcrA